MTSARITPEQRAIVLEAIRGGLNLTSAARRVGRSGSWLDLARKANPDLEEEVQRAMGEYDAQLTEQLNTAIAENEPALANAIAKIRANRFPQLYSDDPRLRHSIQSAKEEHPDDRDQSRPQDEGIPPEIRDAVLTAYYREKDGQS